MDFAEEIGLDDNATVVVIPLAGWGDVRGPDLTKERRDYRRMQAENNSKQARSMR
jgi:protein phosphatase PTC6